MSDSRWRSRSPTPPPINHPIADDDDDDSSSDDGGIGRGYGKLSWFYALDAGGMKLNFGKHRGQRIHDTSISYLYWCFRTFKYDHPVLEAFKIYLTGLEEHAKTAYDTFVVPFGRKHKGKTIRQCRDKEWLRWTIRQKVLTKKHPIFFVAVQHWLNNPRHYEVTRDIGELLSRSEYEDGIDLSGPNKYEDDPTLSNDDDDDDDEGDLNSEDDWEGVPTQADLDFIDDGPVEDGVSSNDERKFEYAIPETREKRRLKKSKQKRSAQSRSELDREFIVPDDDDQINDSQDYIGSVSENDYKTPRRVTRSTTNMLLQNRQKAPVSPTSSRLYKHASSAVPLSDGDDSNVPSSTDTLPLFATSSRAKRLGRKRQVKRQRKQNLGSEAGFVERRVVSPKPISTRGPPEWSSRMRKRFPLL